MGADNVIGLVLAVLLVGLPGRRPRVPGEAVMSGATWLQFLVLIALVAGGHAAARRLHGQGLRPRDGRRPRGERFFAPIERAIYRLTGVDAEREQRWTVYARSLLAFSMVSVLFVYLMQRVQGGLPVNPTDVGAVPEPLAFNTAVSFVTNTNWQNYAGEITMSHLTQMAALAVQNFVSAAAGMAVAVALVRGLVRRRSATIGNFWVDLTRVGHPRPAARLGHRGAGPRQPGRHPELRRVHGRPHARGRGAAHPRRPGGQPGGHQGARHQRRRVPQRQLGPPVRQPQRRSRTSSRCS